MAKVKPSKDIHTLQSNNLKHLSIGKSSKQRLIVVANRLPVSVVRKGEDSWALDISSGGLVSALLGVEEFETRWIGWAGINVPDKVGQITLTKAMVEKKCIPVFLDEEIVSQYYNGYCNNILWPLFHYLGFSNENLLATTHSFRSQFDAYKKANQIFADVVNQHYQEGDIVWCHDYHLMFLPKFLKEYHNSMKVGLFFHTPFPSTEIYRTLPSWLELLRAVLAADLVGFQTYDYARYFVSACIGILGLQVTPDGVESRGKLTRVGAFPIGIDSDRFIRAPELPEVKKYIKEMKERFAGRKVILGVDRLDTIKGIPHKFLAFEKILEKLPNSCDVILLQIAVPSRVDVEEYQKLTYQIHEIVGRINGKFGTLTANPIQHLDRSFDFAQLCALYSIADVALITSLRDGMNLVSYEFVACQSSKQGVLILSEFAGAAQSLGAGAILVNPWDVNQIASSILNALNMPFDERKKRHHHNFMHVTTHTSQKWANTFVSALNDIAPLWIKHIPPLLPVNTATKKYVESRNRLLILGFNGTLTEPLDAIEPWNTSEKREDQLKEMELKLHPELKIWLQKLCNDQKTTIVVISGSDKNFLDEKFGEYNMWLAAEHGMFLRHTKGEWMTTMPKSLNMDCVNSVKHVFEYFTERTPRSHFKLLETSLVWNYKYPDDEFGKLQARDMLQHLCTGPISNAPVDVIQGDNSVEVRAIGVTKGVSFDRILREIVHNKEMHVPIDYVLCIGHFLPKDEDIYTFFESKLLSDTTATIRHTISNTLGTTSSKIPAQKIGSKISQNKTHQQLSSPKNKASNVGILQEGFSMLNLRDDNYFSCVIGWKHSKARYFLNSSEEVIKLLKDLSEYS